MEVMPEAGDRPFGADVLNRFQKLDPVDPRDLVGLWKGHEVPSGHPFDGILENLNWFGKRFHSDLRADALLFRAGPSRLIPVDPRFVPLRFVFKAASFGRSRAARNWFFYLRKVLRARGTTASLTSLELEGQHTAAMVYDNQPITDYFRRIDDNMVMGMMCVKEDPRRFFFLLSKRLP